MPQNTLSKLAESPLRRARTKIVATVGPACDTAAGLSRLVEAGVDVFRMNMAHGSQADHDRVVDTIDSVRATQRPLALLVDLAGPKIRLGELHTEPTVIHEGAEFHIVRGTKAQAANELVSNYNRLIDDMQVGDCMMLADGTLPEEAEPFIRSTYSDVCGIQLEHDVITETISEIESDQVGLNESLRNLSASLNDLGKESVMKAAFAIATADFKIAPSEIELLKEIGDALRMTPAHVEGVIQTLLEEVGATPRIRGL